MRRFAAGFGQSLYRETLYLMLNTAIVAAAGFLFWLVAAKAAPAEQVGRGSALVSAVILITLFSKLGLDFALLRLLPGSTQETRRLLTQQALAIASLTSLSLSILFLITARYAAPELAESLTHPLARLSFVACTVLFTQGTLLDAILIGLNQSRYVVARSVLFAFVRVGAVWLLAPKFAEYGILTAATGAMVLLSVPTWLSLRRELSPDSAAQMAFTHNLRALRSAVGDYVPSLILGLALPVGSLLSLERLGPVGAAKFYILWMIGSVALTGPNALAQTMIVHEASSNRRSIGWTRLLALSGGGAAAAVGGGYLLLPFFGAEYEARLVELVPFALASLPASVMYARIARLRVQGRWIYTTMIAATYVGCIAIGLTFYMSRPEEAGLVLLASTVLAGLVSTLGDIPAHE